MFECESDAGSVSDVVIVERSINPAANVTLREARGELMTRLGAGFEDKAFEREELEQFRDQLQDERNEDVLSLVPLYLDDCPRGTIRGLAENLDEWATEEGIESLPDAEAKVDKWLMGKRLYSIISHNFHERYDRPDPSDPEEVWKWYTRGGDVRQTWRSLFCAIVDGKSDNVRGCMDSLCRGTGTACGTHLTFLDDRKENRGRLFERILSAGLYTDSIRTSPKPPDPMVVIPNVVGSRRSGPSEWYVGDQDLDTRSYEIRTFLYRSNLLKADLTVDELLLTMRAYVHWYRSVSKWLRYPNEPVEVGAAEGTDQYDADFTPPHWSDLSPIKYQRTSAAGRRIEEAYCQTWADWTARNSSPSTARESDGVFLSWARGVSLPTRATRVMPSRSTRQEPDWDTSFESIRRSRGGGSHRERSYADFG
jgi:hypothetical protein